MRSRPAVLSACLIALTIGVVLAGVTAGSARVPSARSSICPQSGRLVSTTTCCGPPTDVASTSCCGDTADVCPAPGLTLSSSADPTTAGSRIVLSGGLTGASTSGVTIKLWQRLPSASGFSQTLSTTTSATGGFSFTFAKGSVTTNRAWYATGDGLTSPTVHEEVTETLTIAASTRRRHAVLHGAVTPAIKGTVVLERLASGGRWTTLGRARLSRSSTFSWRSSYAVRGDAKVRAVLLPSADYDESFSRSIKARVLRR